MHFIFSRLDVKDLLILSLRWFRKALYKDSSATPGEEEDGSFVSRNGWIPLVAFMIAQFGVGLGMKNVPFILATEYFPTAIRPQVPNMSFLLALIDRIVYYICK